MLEVVQGCLGDLCCDSGLGVSILLTHHLPGVSPFTLNRFLIFEQTDAFPDPSLDPVLAQPRQEVCPRTQRKPGRTEKREERERVWGREWEGWNKSKTDACTRVIQHFKKLSGDGAKCLWSLTISPFISSSHFIFVLDIVSFHIPQVTTNSRSSYLLLYHISWPMLTHLETTQPLSLRDRGFPSSQVIRGEASETWC